ncbi:MAG TPA: hypothetical protein VNE58_17905 [Casimicrobiaceae bacterium]|nr:hypothetical protein [Casimicrobiaceae bacterium]
MSLTGQGAVAIWHDIAPEGRAGFYAWHGLEHMPERAAIPGFVRGRRYVAIEGTPQYFNLYETTSTSVLTGSDYLARLNAPTSWTVATVKHFRHVARALCRVAMSKGSGDGGLVATFRYDIEDDAALIAGVERLVASIAAEPDVAGAHLLIADTAGSAIETAEKRARSEGTAIPRVVALVESWGDSLPFVARARAFAVEAFQHALPQPDWAVYRLQNTRANR